MNYIESLLKVETLLEKIVNTTTPIIENADNLTSNKSYMCPLCRSYVYSKDDWCMNDINHDKDCAWVLAKEIYLSND